MTARRASVRLNRWHGVIALSVLLGIIAIPTPSMGRLPGRVTIVDRSEGNYAKVTEEGRLLVSLGHDPLTVDGSVDVQGTVAVDGPVDVTLDEPIDVTLDEPIDVTLDEPIDVTLDEPVDVSGTVTAQSDIDASQYVHLTAPVPDDGDCDLVYTVPAGSDLIITSIQVAPFVVLEFDGVPDPKPFRQVDFHIGGTCSTPFAAASMTSADTAVLPFVPGVVVPSGSGLHAHTFGGSIVDGYVFVYGYTIPS